jgi:hypothetical protein
MPATHFHQAIMPGGIGQAADLFCRLRDYVGITKLVDKFHHTSLPACASLKRHADEISQK